MLCKGYLMETKFFLLPSLLCLIFSAALAQTDAGYSERGIISYYTDKYEERQTASGEKFDNDDYVACHNKIPFNSRVRVTNLSNGRSVIVRINDRGPYAYGRIMDISKAAALKIGLLSTGTAKAEIKVLSEREWAQESFQGPDAEPITENRRNEDTPKPPSRVALPNKKVEAFSPGRIYSPWGNPRIPKGWGVQVASFQNLEGAKKFTSEIRNQGFGEEEIFIQVKDGSLAYKVVMGQFTSREATQTLKNKILQKTGKTSFSVAYP